MFSNLLKFLCAKITYFTILTTCLKMAKFTKIFIKTKQNKTNTPVALPRFFSLGLCTIFWLLVGGLLFTNESSLIRGVMSPQNDGLAKQCKPLSQGSYVLLQLLVWIFPGIRLKLISLLNFLSLPYFASPHFYFLYVPVFICLFCLFNFSDFLKYPWGSVNF